jgi:hypothetical protein
MLSAVTSTAAPPAHRIHPAWWVAGVTFLALVGAAAFRAVPGVLIEPLRAEFDWSVTTISAAVAVNMALYGLTAPFAAALMERFGIRRVVVGALLLTATGSGLTVFMTASWQLVLLWGFAVGLGTGSMALSLVRHVTGRWFVARRGWCQRHPHRRRCDRAAGVPPARRGWARPAAAGGPHRWARPAAALPSSRSCCGCCATGRATSAPSPYGGTAPTTSTRCAPAPPRPRCAGRAASRSRPVLAAGRWLLHLRAVDQRAGASRTSSRPRTTTACR